MSYAKELAEFDPNKHEFVPWATWAPGHPQFKLHKKRGGAITRYNGNDYAILYEMGKDGIWHEVMHKSREEHHGKCQLCGTGTLVDQYHPSVSNRWRRHYLGTDDNGNDQYDIGEFVLHRRGGKITHPLQQTFACPQCAAVLA